jgi:hypothetical protein
MKAHISILGLVYGILGLLELLGAVLLGLFGVGGGLAAWLGGGEGSAMGGMLVGLFGVGFALILGCYGLLTALTAWGLLTRTTWGRWLGVIASVMHVLSFSWISLFGLYGLWALLGKGSSEAFRNKL